MFQAREYNNQNLSEWTDDLDVPDIARVVKDMQNVGVRRKTATHGDSSWARNAPWLSLMLTSIYVLNLDMRNVD